MQVVRARLLRRGANPVNPDFGEDARALVASSPGDVASSTLAAARAAAALDALAKHLARLLGDAGVQLLLKRSVAQAAATFPWLAGGASAGTVTSRLRAAMEAQEPDAISEAFVAVLSAFVGLLERLIGEGLVERLLAEVWPDVFTHAAKESL
jgi:hypothetical protein